METRLKSAWYAEMSSLVDINPKSYHLIAFELVNPLLYIYFPSFEYRSILKDLNPLLYIYFPSFEYRSILKDLKSTLPSSVALCFVTSIIYSSNSLSPTVFTFNSRASCYQQQINMNITFVQNNYKLKESMLLWTDYFQTDQVIKVTPTTFWLKCINLPKCPRFCSTRKLEGADKYFRLLTKNYLMHWQIRGLNDSISGNIWVVYSNL